MNKDVIDWIEKISNETVKCKCGLECSVTLTIRKWPGVEVRAYCSNCNKTASVYEPIYLVKEANIDLVEEMVKSLQCKFMESLKNESTD